MRKNLIVILAIFSILLIGWQSKEKKADVVQIWGQVTLVFVRTQGEWKITHEHHSALNKEESS